MNVVGKYRYYMDSAGEHGRLPIIVDIILVRTSHGCAAHAAHTGRPETQLTTVLRSQAPSKPL